VQHQRTDRFGMLDPPERCVKVKFSKVDVRKSIFLLRYLRKK
jgi:hypothetical protein